RPPPSRSRRGFERLFVRMGAGVDATDQAMQKTLLLLATSALACGASPIEGRDAAAPPEDAGSDGGVLIDSRSSIDAHARIDARSDAALPRDVASIPFVPERPGYPVFADASP